VQILELEWLVLLASLRLLTIEAADLYERSQELSRRQAGVLSEKLGEFCTGKNSACRCVFLG